MKRMVGVGLAAVLLVVGGTLARGTTGDAKPLEPAMPKAQAIEMGDLCEAAGREKLQPRVTETGNEVRYERIDGTDWTVRATLNHKTNWSDNWFDVTCVVAWTSPTATVKSVDATPRDS